MIAWASYPYAGTVVLVTGAGTGIGRGIARAFLEQGASVVLVGRTEAALREAADGFPDALVLAADLTVQGASDAVVSAALERFGRLDVVVANAGTSESSPVDTFDDAAWERLRSINLDALSGRDESVAISLPTPPRAFARPHVFTRVDDPRSTPARSSDRAPAHARAGGSRKETTASVPHAGETSPSRK